MAGHDREYTSVEICAGAGGQAIGLHQAGFSHRALIEIDKDACATLRANLSKLKGSADCAVHELDLKLFTQNEEPEPGQYNIASLGLRRNEIDLLAGGVPCPPFSLAGKQLGRDDERDLFPVMLEMVEALNPKAVMIENVRGLLEPEEKFAPYREEILQQLKALGYVKCGWEVLEARNYRVPQLRPRAILVAMKEPYATIFGTRLPSGDESDMVTVADKLKDSMKERFDAFRGTEHEDLAARAYKRWLTTAEAADTVAPTLVGGSKKHGGADLGPTRAKRAWKALGVNGLGVADEDPLVNPERHLFNLDEGPMLTARQAALIQGFPSNWDITGRKTAAYRQVGNAFPPPVARAVGEAILAALRKGDALAETPGQRQGEAVIETTAAGVASA